MEDRETIARSLRSAGLKCTAPRLAVLAHLMTRSAPQSHAEITAALEAKTGFSRETLYRNLIDLANAGLVTRTDHGDHVWRFEIASEHPHFVCEACGQIECLPGAVITVDHPSAKRRPGRAPISVQLRGRCDGCA